MERQGGNEVMKLRVEANMRENPPRVRPSDPISVVIEKMLGEDIGAIIVIERDETPVGIITEKDLIERVVEPNRDIDVTLVQEVMSKPIVTIESDETVAEALRVMHEKNIRRLAVTSEDLFVGIITERRLLEAVFREI
jgi:CBS domain-containing protein